jgi:hypothetical protein
VWGKSVKGDFIMNEPNQTIYNDIRHILDTARQKAFSAVNFAMVEAYWQIGKRIVDEEQQGEERRKETVILDEAMERELDEVEREILRIIYLEVPPKAEQIKWCRTCAYGDFNI